METNAPPTALIFQAPAAAPSVGRVLVNHRALATAWAADLDARAAAGQLSTRTAEVYRKAAAAWLDWMDLAGVETPSPADVQAFVAVLRDGHLPATVNARLAAVRCLYQWAETQNAYPSIGRSVRGLPVRKDEPLECLEPGQVAALLNKVEGNALAALRDRALVRVLFATACRLVSLAAANVEDLDMVDASLLYCGKGDRETKARRAYLPPSALSTLQAYLDARRAAEGNLDPSAPLFAAAGNRAWGQRLTTRSLRRIGVGLMERAGHVQRNETGHIARPGVFSAHSLRRSSVTAAYDAKGLDAAQALAGHADPKTTRKAYARIQKGRVLRELAGVLDLGCAV